MSEHDANKELAQNQAFTRPTSDTQVFNEVPPMHVDVEGKNKATKTLGDLDDPSTWAILDD